MRPVAAAALLQLVVRLIVSVVSVVTGMVGKRNVMEANETGSVNRNTPGMVVLNSLEICFHLAKIWFG